MRAEGKHFGGYRWKLSSSVGLTLATLLLLQACSSSEREFASGSAGSGGSAGSSGAGDGGNDGTLGGSSSGDACEPGTVEPCYESPEGESYGEVPDAVIGSCKIGMRICGTSATWGACLGAVAAAEVDTCVPGNDDDCSGTPNEGCGCTEPSTTRPCGTDEGECVAVLAGHRCDPGV